MAEANAHPWLRGLRDVVFPPSCVQCRDVVETEPDGGPQTFRHLCVRCVAQLEFVRPPHCLTCGHCNGLDVSLTSLGGFRLCEQPGRLIKAFGGGSVRTGPFCNPDRVSSLVEIEWRVLIQLDCRQVGRQDVGGVLAAL